jgi:hypothetical protein
MAKAIDALKKKVPKVLPSSFLFRENGVILLNLKNELVYNLLQIFFSVVKVFLLIALQHCLSWK